MRKPKAAPVKLTLGMRVKHTDGRVGVLSRRIASTERCWYVDVFEGTTLLYRTHWWVSEFTAIQEKKKP